MTDRMKKPEPRDQELVASCQCGKVAFIAVGRPIMSAACYSKSCQEAARRFAQLPAAPAILNPEGGTDFLLHRKDRVRCERGADLHARAPPHAGRAHAARVDHVLPFGDVPRVQGRALALDVPRPLFR